MSRNQILIAVGSVIAIFIFLFGAYVMTNKPKPTSFPEVNKVLASDHVKWATDSATIKNILVEYGDFQCPACKSFYEFMATEIEASGAANQDVMKNTAFVYRNYPLFSIHQHAEDAAYAAEAAGKQGKFFEMGDLLYQNQASWQDKGNAREIFEGYAKQLELDMDQFKKDRDSKEVKEKVNADMLSGDQAGVNSTPSFYLNGVKLDISSFDEFRELLKNPQ